MPQHQLALLIPTTLRLWRDLGMAPGSRPGGHGGWWDPEYEAQSGLLASKEISGRARGWRAVGLPLPHQLDGRRAARCTLYGPRIERCAVGSGYFCAWMGQCRSNSGGGDDSGAALVQEIPAYRPGIEKTAKNPISAAAAGEARNHWRFSRVFHMVKSPKFGK